MSDCGCEQTRANLYEVLRGELCAEESAPIREHLANCPSCRDEETVCISLTEVVKRACAEDNDQTCPEELRARVIAALTGATD